MTTPRLHIEKAQRNEARLGPLSTGDDEAEWYITISFYAGVHWLRSLFAHHGWGVRAGEQIPYDEFPDYFQKLKQRGIRLGSLEHDFKGFKGLAHKARYDCYDPPWYASRRQDAKDYLDAIRAFAQNAANHPPPPTP